MTYYNEHDSFAAGWLQRLADGGQVAPGAVDGRSIEDVKPEEVGDGQAHFFAGIGGWSLALRLAGVPDGVPVWTGSCPCQPFSAAGKGLGVDDPRHLWPVWRELIAERRPSVVFGEQVASPAGRDWLAAVRSDLEALGYAVGSADLCAAGVGAPHIRQRLFWGAVRLGDADSIRAWWDSRAGTRAEAQGEGSRVEPRGDRDGACTPGADDRGLPNTNSLDGGRDLRERELEARRAGGGLRDPAREGLAGRAGVRGDHGPRSEAAERTDGAVGPWDRVAYVRFSDGKVRPVPAEPGLQPLAYGVPGRVGILRGAGNAIVPQVAAVFIASFLDAVRAAL